MTVKGEILSGIKGTRSCGMRSKARVVEVVEDSWKVGVSKSRLKEKGRGEKGETEARFEIYPVKSTFCASSVHATPSSDSTDRYFRRCIEKPTAK